MKHIEQAEKSFFMNTQLNLSTKYWLLLEKGFPGFFKFYVRIW